MELINKLSQNPKKLFLIDGIGALVTIGCLLVIARFEELFGMPAPIVYVLASIVTFYSLYSLGCSAFIRPGWAPFLKIIAWANSLYCMVTAVLIVQFLDQLTIWGLAYFIGEILVIMVLVWVELCILKILR